MGPRGHFEYSALGYIIAGAIAEKVADGSFEDLLVDRVFSPLGVTTAGFGPMGTPGLDDQPLQHSIHHAPILPTPTADHHPVYAPAGTIHMSIGDWALFAHWVMAADAGAATLVDQATAAVMLNPVVRVSPIESYALGWYVLDFPDLGGRVLTHGGSNGFNYSRAILAPRLGVGVIVTTNIDAPTTELEVWNLAVHLITLYRSDS